MAAAWGQAGRQEVGWGCGTCAGCPFSLLVSYISDCIRLLPILPCLPPACRSEEVPAGDPLCPSACWHLSSDCLPLLSLPHASLLAGARQVPAGDAVQRRRPLAAQQPEAEEVREWSEQLGVAVCVGVCMGGVVVGEASWQEASCGQSAVGTACGPIQMPPSASALQAPC